MPTTFRNKIWNLLTKRQQENDEQVENLRLMEKAAAYEALVQSLGWRHLLDFLEHEANEAIGKLRKVNLSDRDAAYNELIIWRDKEEVLLGVQYEVIGTIEQKRALVAANSDEKEGEPVWQTQQQ